MEGEAIIIIFVTVISSRTMQFYLFVEIIDTRAYAIATII